MILDRFNIAELEESDEIPDRNDMPGNRHLLEMSWGDAMRAAFAVQTKDEAEVELLMIVAIHLHQAGGVISWREAFIRARQSIGWFALAADVAAGLYEGKTGPESGKDAHTVLISKREITTMRDLAFGWYGARIWLRDTSDERRKERGERMERVTRRIVAKPSRKPAVEQQEQGSLF